jgi:hypothetical protein
MRYSNAVQKNFRFVVIIVGIMHKESNGEKVGKIERDVKYSG